MSTTKTFAGASYNLPLNREPKSSSWGTEVSNFLIALADNAIPKTGGSYTLAAELNLGATYGLLAPYYKSATSNIAAAGQVRLARADTVSWRNQANGADLALGVDSSNRLTFNSVVLATAGAASIVNADISASAAIAYSKLALTGAILNADLAGSIADSKLSTISTALKVSNSATTAASANTASAIVARDGSGNFTAGTITANLTGNVTGNTSGTAANVTGVVLPANGGTGATTAALGFAALSPLTTKGDIQTFSTLGTRLGVGGDGTVLMADAAQTTGLKWASVAATVTTTRGDLISRGASADTRLAIGTAGKILTTDGTDPSWSSTITALTGFTGGVFGVSNIRASEGAGTTTLTGADMRTQVFNLSNGRSVKLPTTGIKAGEVWTMVNQSSGANALDVQSSAGTSFTVANSANMDATIYTGYVRIMALQDTPTTPAHWWVIDLAEKYSVGTITSQNSGALTSNTVTSAPFIARNNKTVTFYWNGTSSNTANAGATTFSFANGTISTRFLPLNDINFVIAVRDNGATGTSPGLLQFDSVGAIRVFKALLQTSIFTNGTSIGVPDRGNFTWITA